MYNIIPLILILVSLSIIISIIVRKFSALASLDIENIQSEREAKIKEQIVSNKLKRNIIKWLSKFSKIFIFLGQKINDLFKIAYKRLYELKNKYKEEEVLLEDDKEGKIKMIFNEINELDFKENFEEIEKKLIEIIGLDSKNIEAFKMLGNIYLENKKFEEGKQTYSHILKLIKEDEDDKILSEIYFNISNADLMMEKFDDSLENIKKAIEIEPNNPRYIDTMINLSIIKKDKILALDSYEKLEKVNPENKKLIEFKEKISKL